MRTAAIRRCCKDTDFSYKTKCTRLIYTPLLRVKAAPDEGEGCTRWARRLHQMGVTAAPDGREGCTRWARRLHQMCRAFPPIFPPLPHLWRGFSDTTPQKLRRLPKNLPRFSENLPRNFEKVQRFPKKLRRNFENLPRFCPTCAAIFLLSLPQLKINH